MFFIKITFQTILFFFLVSCSIKRNDESLIKLRLNENPSSLDPLKIVDLTQGELSAKIFSGLLEFNEKLEIVPDLAESFLVSKNSKNIKFTLRKNLKFSNGMPLTVNDVLFSFKRILAKENGCPRKWVLEKIKGASLYSEGISDNLEGFRIIDERSFEIELEKPFSSFLSLLTMPTAAIIPEKIYSDPLYNAARMPIGAGPYMLSKWEQDISILFEPNPNYHNFNKSNVSILYKIIPEDSSSIAMMATNELDIIKVPRTQVKFVEKKYAEKCSFYKVEELNTYFLGFDHRKNYIDINLKKKILNSIEPLDIINSVLKGQAEQAFTPVPSSLLSNDLKKWIIENALNKKNNNISLNDKRVLNFITSSAKEAVSVCVILQDQLKKNGINTELKTYDWSAFKYALEKGDADIFFLSWWGDYADAENFLFPLFHSENFGSKGNRVYYSNEKMDELLNTLHKSFINSEKDNAIKGILKEFFKEIPFIPLWHRTTVYAVSDRIEGFYPVPVYSMDKGNKLKIRNIK